MKVCALFPGQGFQRFGMLARLAQTHSEIVNSILEECDAILPNLQLSKLLLGVGPEKNTTPTEIAQPLLLVQGYAHFKVWSHLNPQLVPKFGMGHSLGEYAALTCANILQFKDALQLVRSRGECMRDAALLSSSSDVNDDNGMGMTLVVKPRSYKSSWPELMAACSKQSNADIAAFNSNSQTVVSGKHGDIKRCIDLVESECNGRVLTKTLPVSSAFHSKYMQPAASELAKLIENLEWSFDTRKFDVISNVSGLPYDSIAEIKRSCVDALTSPVLWLQSVQFADQNGIDEFIAFGGEIGKLMEKDITAKTSTFV